MPCDGLDVECENQPCPNVLEIPNISIGGGRQRRSQERRIQQIQEYHGALPEQSRTHYINNNFKENKLVPGLRCPPKIAGTDILYRFAAYCPCLIGSSFLGEIFSRLQVPGGSEPQAKALGALQNAFEQWPPDVVNYCPSSSQSTNEIPANMILSIPCSQMLRYRLAQWFGQLAGKTHFGSSLIHTSLVVYDTSAMYRPYDRLMRSQPLWPRSCRDASDV